MLGPEWQLKPRVHSMAVTTLLDCVTELGTATQALTDKRPLFETDGGARVLQSIVRQISIPLRKLCLDDDGALLKKVVADPSFHPLGGSKARYRQATMSWRTERREWDLGYDSGKREAVVVPETEHTIEIEDSTASTSSKMGGATYTARSTSQRRLSLCTIGSAQRLFK